MKKYKAPPVEGVYFSNSEQYGCEIIYAVKSDNKMFIYLTGTDITFCPEEFWWFIGPIPEPNADKLEFED